MATYKGILTNNGKALIASATVNNKINYSHIAVGDGNGSVPDPSETRTALVNEKARIALNVVEINPNNTNQIMCEAIIPSNIGGFYIRELGLFAGPTMVVNANYPPTLKPLPDDGGAREINIKMVINIQNAEVIALYLDDSLIYATREWVKTNYIRRNEIVDNLITNDSNKPLSAKQGKALQDNKLEISRNLSDLKSSEVARKNLSLDKFAQNLNLNTAVGAPNVDAAIIITNTGWGVYKNSSATNFDPALPTLNGGTGRTDGKAQALVTPRTVQFSGSATGSFSYDGSANSSCILTLSNSGVVASTYGSALKIPTITVNQQGLITGVSEKEVTKANLSLDKFTQNPNQNTAVGAPNVDAAIIITNTGWGVYKNSSATNFDPALPINYGGTGRTDGKAQALVTPRTVQFSGSATGSFSYDGSANSSCILTLSNSGVVASTYGSALKIPTITVNQQGLITGVSEKEVTKANLSLDKFTQNPNQNTAVGAPNVDAAIIITNTGWGVYKNSSATNFDPALPTLNGGTGRTDGKAQALVTPRTVKFSGSATGSFSYDGSANSSCILTLSNSGVVASTYGSALKIPTITVNQQGLITGVSEKEVTKANLSLDKFTQNPNQNTAVGAPNVDAAIIITNTGWGVYKNSSATNFDPALPINYGGTGSTTVLGAKYNLRLDKFVQDPYVTSIYAPTTDSRIVITDKSWGIWSVDPTFEAALPVSNGGTGNTQGIAPSAAKLQISRNIALSGAVSGSANFDGAGNIVINTVLNSTWSYLETGYKIHADGLIEQWGYISGDSDETIKTVYFPVAFTTRCLNIQVSRMRKYGTTLAADADGGALVLEGTIGNSSFVIDHQRFNSNSVGNLGGTMWRAIGY